MFSVRNIYRFWLLFRRFAFINIVILIHIFLIRCFPRKIKTNEKIEL